MDSAQLSLSFDKASLSDNGNARTRKSESSEVCADNPQCIVKEVQKSLQSLSKTDFQTNSSTSFCTSCSHSLSPGAAIRTCSICHRWIHLECDHDSNSVGSVEVEYICPPCRNSPLVADAMMTSASGGSLAPSPASISTHDDSSRNAIFDNVYSHASSNRNSPFTELNLDSSFNDIFSITHQSNQEEGPSSVVVSNNAENCSSEASPVYYSDANAAAEIDEFHISNRREKSEGVSHSHRGGRNGVSKPLSTLLRSNSMRTRSFAGFHDVSDYSISNRGKRGARGAMKNGRGRRSRGGKTSSMLALVSAATAAIASRETDQESSEPEELKNRLEENEYIRTVVITDAEDTFFLQMPVCLICGSIGKDVEGTMVSCATCAQSYHTFCVGLHNTLNQTIVKRGWRCLNCMICETCGEARDESHLILCDECDISYHTYCLPVRLDHVPQGSWRCKWCSACRRCEKQIEKCTDLHRMESLCETCFSLRKCLRCYRFYEIGDEIIKCQHCSRWFHGKCEEVFGEEILEAASEHGFRCSLCRPHGKLQINDSLNILVCDNVAMNRSAWEVLQMRYGGLLTKSSLTFHNETIYGAQYYGYGARTHSYDDIMDDEEVEITPPMPSGRGRGMRGGPGRRVLKLGVGGFFVRIPRHRLLAAEEDTNGDDDSALGKPKIKRPRKPRRSQLEDNYPPVIQESFFGMRPIEGRVLIEMVVEEPTLQEIQKTVFNVEKHHLPCELSETSVDALRDGESVLDIMENEIMNNIESIDFDNLDIGIFGVYDEEDDDVIMDVAESEENGGTEEGMSSMQTSNYEQQHIVPFGYSSSMAQNRQFDARRSDEIVQNQNRASISQQNLSYPLQSNIQSQSNSRCSSQMAESFIERVNQATERWEEDEPLGERATKAAVLYANVNHPEWKKDYPEWNERVKQIHRMWRSLDANSRQEYVNRARENRANRAKIPKVKRVHAGCVRAIASSSQCSSPLQIGMSGTTYYSQGIERTGGAVLTDTRNQASSLAHLSKDILDNYSLLQQRSNELFKYQTAIENDLARMRKQKKNLTAKRRQLNKNNQKFDANGLRIDVELNDTDKSCLAMLINAIPIRQKDLENCKRDIKEHSSSVRDFEVKNNIPSDFANQMASQAASLNMNNIRSPNVTSSGLRPPPPYSFVSDQRQNIAHNYQVSIGTHRFSSTRPDIDGSQFGSGSSTPSNSRRESVGSADWTKQRLGRKRKTEDDLFEEYERPAKLGDVYASSITSQIELDVFDVVDHLLTQVAIMVHGAEAAKKSGILKRLLEPLSGKLCSPQKTFTSDDLFKENCLLELHHFENIKPKKKRSQQKKLPVGSSNEYELLLERISTQLRLCPPLPRRALEPVPRIDRSSLSMFGVTDLPDRTEKCSIAGDKIGSLRLLFMHDYYTRMFECPIEEKSLYPSMSFFCNDVKMTSLYQAQITNTNFLWLEDSELDRSSMKMKSLSVDRRSRSPPLRTISRIPEAISPQPPHRSSFLKPPNLIDQVAVSIIMEGEDGFDPEYSYRQLMKLLDINPCPDFKMDTPPDTPINCKGEIQEQSKIDIHNEISHCRNCNSIIKHSVVPQSKLIDEEKEGEASFCSMSCYYNFIVNAGIALSTDDLQKAERFVDEETLSKLRQISAENFAKYLHLGKMKSENISTPVGGDGSPLDSRLAISDPDSQSYKLQTIYARELSALIESKVQKVTDQKWKGRLWMQYDAELLESFQHLASQVRQKHMAIQLQSSEGMRAARKDDARTCAFCGIRGDGDIDVCGRLINADANTWVHVNCAIWSQEVYENSSGALSNVDEALRRSTDVLCLVCKRSGASLRCYKLNCESHFHLACAKSANGHFMKDKTFICSLHDDIRPELSIDRLDALRRIYIDRNENKVLAKLFHSNGNQLILRIGTLIFHQLGQLLPDQLKSFHNSDYIFPIGYRITRIYWSPLNRMEKIRYNCSIADNRSGPQFIITYEGGKEIREFSCTNAWNRIVTMVQNLRQKQNNDVLKLFPVQIIGETLYGLNETAISKMIESLPGIDQLATYSFKHGGSPLMDLPLAVNPCGCTRSERRFRTLIKHKRRNQPAVAASIHSNIGLDIVSRDTRNRGGPAASLEQICSRSLSLCAFSNDLWNPYARWETGPLSSSYYSQYQKMKKEWKNTVYLARSRIQGLGLFASRDIEMNAMIIEYKGELIRTEVGEMREKRYEAQNRGVYMFRIDDERLIDATMAGGPARYINHSCDPNCSTRLVDSGPTGDDKKIIIIANRPISAGEELTYDYQFDIEDTNDKIACLCGAPNCQKWMN